MHQARGKMAACSTTSVRSVISRTLSRASTLFLRTCNFETKRPCGNPPLKVFSTNSSVFMAEKYRKVNENIVGDTLEIEATYEEAGANYNAVDNPHGACPICSQNLYITYKDVLILSQFVDNEGNVLPRDLTGVCAKQQLRLRECVERAIAADLLPNHRPSHLPKPQDKDPGKAAFHRF